MHSADFSLEYGNADSRKLARSRDELAQMLGCSTITVARMLKEPGNPGRNANGTYVVATWRDYYDERKENLGDELSLDASARSRLGEIRIRREEARAAREELLLEKERGNVVPVQDVETSWLAAYEKIKQIFHAEIVEKESDPETFDALEDRFRLAVLKIAQAFAVSEEEKR